MSKKIGLYIGGRRFDVNVDNEFAKFLEQQMERDFKIEGNNDPKLVMQAYVRKVYGLYRQEKKIAEILKKLEE